MKQNDLIYQIEKMKETIYICEAEKLSPKALDRLRDKLGVNELSETPLFCVSPKAPAKLFKLSVSPELGIYFYYIL